MNPQKQPIIANHYFSYVSTEVQEMFGHGYYYGCIALCQSLAEAYARFLHQRTTGNPPANDFLPNIHKLEVANTQSDIKKLLDDVKNSLLGMYGDGQERNAFHHLNPTVPTDHAKLKEMAIKKIALLNMVESQVFACSIAGGGLTPKYEIFWDKNDGMYGTYLRLE